MLNLVKLSCSLKVDNTPRRHLKEIKNYGIHFLGSQSCIIQIVYHQQLSLHTRLPIRKLTYLCPLIPITYFWAWYCSMCKYVQEANHDHKYNYSRDMLDDMKNRGTQFFSTCSS